jgi:hypothetical protein
MVIREVHQRFMNSGAVVFLCDVAASVAHGNSHFRNGIRRARRHRCESSVQHRHIIVVIARSENVFARDIQ